MAIRFATLVALAAIAGPAAAQSLGDVFGKAGSALAGKPAAPNSAGITGAEANSGLKAALSKASETVIGQLGRPGGFAGDPKVRIGLPGPLGKLGGVMSFLDKTGVTDNLSGKLNSAAEGAVGKALPLLKTAISNMSVSDAMGIVTGGPTSATDYFRRTMGGGLKTAMQPLVAKSLGGVKAFAALDSFTAQNRLPVGAFGAKDLTDYVTQKTSDGVFLYLADQEKAIRANPLGTGSALIAKVFGG